MVSLPYKTELSYIQFFFFKEEEKKGVASLLNFVVNLHQKKLLQ